MTEDFVEIFRGNHLEADIIRSMLEANGIRVSLIGAGTSAAYPLGVGALGEGRVLVLREDEGAARELLDTDLVPPDGDVDEGPPTERP